MWHIMKNNEIGFKSSQYLYDKSESQFKYPHYIKYAHFKKNKLLNFYSNNYKLFILMLIETIYSSKNMKNQKVFKLIIIFININY